MRNLIRSSAFAALLLAASAFFPGTGSAEPLIKASVAVSEEYNDNIFLLPADGRADDYITRALPSVRFLYKAPLWDWDAAYTYDYRLYARHKDVDNTTQTATIMNTTRLVKEFLFLDARDEYDRVSLSLVRDYTQESIFVNQTDRNILLLNPYAVLRSGPSTTITSGYAYRNTWFKDPAAVDKTDHIVTAAAKVESSARLTLTTSLRHTIDENRVQSYRKSDLVLGPRYEYAESSYLWFSIGGSRLAFEEAEATQQFTWDAGVTYKRPWYTLSLQTALDYVDDPISILRREDRNVAIVRIEKDRTSLEILAGILEYRRAVDQQLEERTQRMRAAFGHAITRTLQGAYEFTLERFEDVRQDALSERSVSDVRFDYQTSDHLMFSVEYRYTNSSSDDLSQDNYRNSRIMAEAKYAF